MTCNAYCVPYVVTFDMHVYILQDSPQKIEISKLENMIITNLHQTNHHFHISHTIVIDMSP